MTLEFAEEATSEKKKKKKKKDKDMDVSQDDIKTEPEDVEEGKS